MKFIEIPSMIDSEFSKNNFDKHLEQIEALRKIRLTSGDKTPLENFFEDENLTLILEEDDCSNSLSLIFTDPESKNETILIKILAGIKSNKGNGFILAILT